jgi:ATP-dependent RNA helicase DDX24/MAK5
LADAALAKEKARSNDTFMKSAAEDLGVEYDEDDLPEMGYSGRGGGRKKKEATAREMSKQEMGMLRAKLRDDLSQRVNLGVSERYITGGRVDVAALLREREKGEGGIFLGGEGLGLGFD